VALREIYRRWMSEKWAALRGKWVALREKWLALRDEGWL
jgi:hypothetical protein